MSITHDDAIFLAADLRQHRRDLHSPRLRQHIDLAKADVFLERAAAEIVEAAALPARVRAALGPDPAGDCANVTNAP